jgi:hypothetical protein
MIYRQGLEERLVYLKKSEFVLPIGYTLIKKEIVSYLIYLGLNFMSTNALSADLG